MKRLLLASALALGACATTQQSPTLTPAASLMDAASWEIGPIFGGKDYSVDEPTHPTQNPDGSFSFTWKPGTSQVHYVTVPFASLTGKTQVVLDYDITPAGADLYGSNCPTKAPTVLTIYLQRRGDNWSGTGQYEAYRWWATAATVQNLGAGKGEIVAPLTGRWTAIESSNSIDQAPAFQAALANTARIGFTFGNCTGYGHGASATATVTFTVTGFRVE